MRLDWCGVTGFKRLLNEKLKRGAGVREKISDRVERNVLKFLRNVEHISRVQLV